VGCCFQREVRLLLFGLGLAIALTLAVVSQASAASGTWERAWGKNVNGGGVFGICTVASSCLTGTSGSLGGEMDTPERIAADGAGNVYVTDQNRIQKFDSSGNWQRAWGKGVDGGAGFEACTVATQCLTGSTGGLGGEMNFPGGIATDGDGNVYLADALNRRIQKFDSSGGWQRAWGRNVVKDGGTGSVCTDAQAGTPTTPCFEICTVAADCQAGAASGLGGEMNVPLGVGIDGSNNVYVVDSNRIQKFDSSGTWERAWGKNVNGGDVFGVCTVAANCLAANSGGLGGEMNSPNGVAIDANGFVYVADQGNQRIQKFSAASGAWQRAWGNNVIQLGHAGDLGGVFEVCLVAADCQAGSTGGLGGEMNSPLGIAIDGSGNVYVSESTGNRIQKFDSSGGWQRAWGKDVIQSGETGDLGTVFEICTTAALCQAGGLPAVIGGEMSSPRGIATDGSGNLYVAEFSSRRIEKFADPVVVPPVTPPATPTTAPTGQRAAAVKKCKKKFPKGPKRTKCIKKAKRLPV
jgi:NHL repeat